MKTPLIFSLARFSLVATAAALLWSPTQATAGLNYDLRVAGGKMVYVTNIGQVITLDLYAQVTGVSSGPTATEGFQDGFGSILSSAGGNIAGNLSSSFVAPFGANGAQPGTQQTLDADADLDIGSNSTAHSTDFFFARAGSMQTAGIAITDGVEFKIASFSFTVTGVGSFLDFSQIAVNFQVPTFGNQLDIEALWQQDGLTMTSNGLNGGLHPTVGTPVMIGVPEPSIAGLLLLTAAGAAARRRRRSAQ